MNSRAWLLDTSIYLFRAWFFLPDKWHTRDGMPLNAVYGYAALRRRWDALAARVPLS